MTPTDRQTLERVLQVQEMAQWTPQLVQELQTAARNLLREPTNDPNAKLAALGGPKANR